MGDMKEIDNHHISLQERRNLLDRLVRVPEDNENFLRKLRDRIDRVGIECPTIEVRYEHLNVMAEAYIGSRSLPSFFNLMLNAIQALGKHLRMLPSRKVPLTILQDASGIIKPHRMTLLLGPLGSGKTTFLLALAGKLGSDLKASGEVTYNGHQMKEFVPQRTAAYVSQQDLHMGELTVTETLAFSARCQGVGPHYEMLTELLRREKEANIAPDNDIDVFMKATSIKGEETGVIVDYMMKILGLDTCANVLVGNAMLTGISGGQKKRVTIGEMIVGPAKVLFMDEISTGLDNMTTFQVVNSLKQVVHILGGTTVVSLLQPPPETYELFDDIILLSDGQIVYQGPRQNVLEFFKFMGFECPQRKSVADFLLEVISRKDQNQYWVGYDEYKYVTAKEFAKEFNSFHVGEKLQKELSIPFDRKKNHRAALITSKYGASRIELLKACARRELLQIRRNSFVYAFKAFRAIFLSIFMATMFWRTTLHHDTIQDGMVYMGTLYFTNINMIFNGFTEIALTITKLPVIFKQRDNHFYPSWAYALPNYILSIPFAIFEVAIWVVLTYFSIGYDMSTIRFFKHYLLLLLINQLTSGLFRFIAVVGRVMVIANVLVAYILLVVVGLNGFLLSHDEIKKWWIWGYWTSPLMYLQNAISTNEFLGRSWSQIIPGTNQMLGISILKSRGLFSEAKWYWIGAAVLFAYLLLFHFFYVIALTYFKPLGRAQPTISWKTLQEKNKNTIGKDVYLQRKERCIQFSASRTAKGRKLSSASKVYEENKIMEMEFPFTSLSMTFENITYSVDVPQEMKAEGFNDKLILLNGVSGCFRPGVLTALMGVTGAGKTTLMDILAGRKTNGYISGNITISGYPKRQETFARVSGYCEQNDIHSPYVTVYESLVYSAWLRLPRESSSVTRKVFIEEVMQLVEMTQLRESLVGLPGLNGLSLEQRKRLTIAVELVANPSIIFMDEPTSGLDARGTAIVMRTARKMVDARRTVVCTIHQPSIDIFEAFDELLLLKRGGEEIYFGPLGKNSCHLVHYFEGIEGVNRIKDGQNPATWMLQVTSPTQEQRLGIDFSEVYKNSNLYQRNKLLTENESQPPCELYFPTQHSQSFVVQCIACLWKQNLSYWRNTSYTALRFFFTLSTALIIGTMFWDLGDKKRNQKDLFNVMGSMYGSVLFLGISYSSNVQPIVETERKIFYKERATGMYSALPYALGQVVAEQPYILTQSFMYAVIVYSMIGFEWKISKFFWFVFFTYFTLLYYTYYGMFVIGLTPNIKVASIVTTSVFGTWNLFSGYIIPQPSMPIWWRWYYWTCPVSWTIYGLLVSQYGDDNTLLDTNQTVAAFLRSNFGFRYEFLRVTALMVVFFAVLFALLFGATIKVLNHQKR